MKKPLPKYHKGDRVKSTMTPMTGTVIDYYHDGRTYQYTVSVTGTRGATEIISESRLMKEGN